MPLLPHLFALHVLLITILICCCPLLPMPALLRGPSVGPGGVGGRMNSRVCQRGEEVTYVAR